MQKTFLEFYKSMDSLRWSKEKKMQKEKTRGLHPGEGGLPENEEDSDAELDLTEPTDDADDVDDVDLSIEEPDTDNPETDEDENPNRQGLISTIPGAHLVYKRKNEDGTYDEMWIFKISNALKDELVIQREILAGTDIPETKMTSKDGTQYYELWTAGDAQILKVFGLPN